MRNGSRVLTAVTPGRRGTVALRTVREEPEGGGGGAGEAGSRVDLRRILVVLRGRRDGFEGAPLASLLRQLIAIGEVPIALRNAARSLLDSPDTRMAELEKHLWMPAGSLRNPQGIESQLVRRLVLQVARNVANGHRSPGDLEVIGEALRYQRPWALDLVLLLRHLRDESGAGGPTLINLRPLVPRLWRLFGQPSRLDQQEGALLECIYHLGDEGDRGQLSEMAGSLDARQSPSLVLGAVAFAAAENARGGNPLAFARLEGFARALSEPFPVSFYQIDGFNFLFTARSLGRAAAHGPFRERAILLMERLEARCRNLDLPSAVRTEHLMEAWLEAGEPERASQTVRNGLETLFRPDAFDADQVVAILRGWRRARPDARQTLDLAWLKQQVERWLPHPDYAPNPSKILASELRRWGIRLDT